MWDYITERVTKEGKYIVETGTTVRAAALYFNISKKYRTTMKNRKICSLSHSKRKSAEGYYGHWL